MVKHLAFTMIELIFAIVIISISVLSIPTLLQVISSNTERSIVQEAIFAASSELNQIISYSWDENSMEVGASLSRVVWDSPTDCNTTTQLRPGHISQPYHRRCADSNVSRPTTAGNFGLEIADAGVLDDLDDINVTIHSIYINPTASATGYKQIHNSTFAIAYANFDPGYNANMNIKRIRVTITDTTTGETITQLNTFSANVGEIDYYKRTY